MEHPVRQLILLLALCAVILAQELPRDSIAYKVYRNECGANPAYLVHWNTRENFASLGIGHFIWYPEGVVKRFDESFPKLVTFLTKKNIHLPNWLHKAAPWKNKTAMQKDPRSKALQQILQKTIPLQALFLVKQLDDALPKMLSTLTSEKQQHLLYNYKRLKKTPNGLYILIDYRNFKGDGSSEKERYNGKGWGLRQVLLCMKKDTSPYEEFILCAKKLLTQRVHNAPASAHEVYWLEGWMNRLDTYLPK